MRQSGFAAMAALLLALGGLGGCGGGGEAETDENSGEVVQDGLSPEEIRQQAEPMSPERAEELGIIDTTIHIEKLTSPEDSALFADTVRPPAVREPGS